MVNTMNRWNPTLLLLVLSAILLLATSVDAQDNNRPPEGFTALIGEDLSNWIGGSTRNPSKITQEQQAKWDAKIEEHWKVDGLELVSDGQGPHLATNRDYGNIELWLDYKIQKGGDSGVYLRGTPQVQIWDPESKPRHGSDKGSGGLWNNKKHERWPSEVADKAVGEWNRMYIRMVGPYVTVILNGKTVTDNVVLENFYDRKSPVLATGTIHLQTHGSETRFRNVFAREITDTESKKWITEIEGEKKASVSSESEPRTDSSHSSDKPMNILFMISDDLTAEALSCYGNRVCKTPNLDKLASTGTRFTRAYCQYPVCGPSRASFMSGYYPHATEVFGYVSGRKAIGDRPTWSEHFKNNGYYTARVSKIFHMGVPGVIEKGTDGADDERSWTERFNSQGPEWKAPGPGLLLEGNPEGDRPQSGGNKFAYVIAEGDDLVHSDGKTAQKAIDLIEARAQHEEPFFLAVGFVRPHVPFVAPAKYYEPYEFDAMVLPGGQQDWDEVPEDWNDIPKAGINYKTSMNMKMDLAKRRAVIGSYYASVSYVDALVGKIMTALTEQGLFDNTIVIFTSDHGFHLGEHDFWAKVSIHEESARVPLIIRHPGKKPAVCDSFVELIDLYPSTAQACGLTVPGNLQGKNILPLLDDPKYAVRDAAFCVNGRNRGFLLRTDDWAYIQYAEDATKGIELYDMKGDPQQLTNLAYESEHLETVRFFQTRLIAKLAEVRDNDLDSRPSKKAK